MILHDRFFSLPVVMWMMAARFVAACSSAPADANESS